MTATIRFPRGGGSGERVRLARQVARRTAEETAQAIGVSVKTLQRIEQNRRGLTVDELDALIEFTGQSDSFFRGASPVADEGPSIPPPLPSEVKEGNTE